MTGSAAINELEAIAPRPTPLSDGKPGSGFGHYLRDLVYGANDGVITTFAIVAGVSGASLSASVALVLGVANLLADGLSMGASNYLSLKSELEQRGADVAAEHPARHGLATFLAFAVAGLVPLAAFPLNRLLSVPQFPSACVLAIVALAAIGGMRAPFVRRRLWRAATEMVAIGALVGAAAYGVGYFTSGLVD